MEVNQGRWNPRLHPRDSNTGRFSDHWVSRISRVIEGYSGLMENKPPVPGDEFHELRLAVGGESEESTMAIVDNIDHYRGRVEVYNPHTGRWFVLGDAWVREDPEDTVAVTSKGGAEFFHVHDRSGDGDFGTIVIRPIGGQNG